MAAPETAIPTPGYAFARAVDHATVAEAILERLLSSPEPSIRYQARVLVCGEEPASQALRALREEVRQAPRTKALLSTRNAGGRIPWHPYAKWSGAHWTLARLAELGYPAGDESLLPLREQVLEWLLGSKHRDSIRALDGRVRRCASQEANAIFALLRLGLADERCDRLAADLVEWQWPDGGWNCDKNPSADTSSFMETLIPLRALALHAAATGSKQSCQAARRAAEVFLSRRMFRRRADGSVIRPEFIKLHYPCYWHYDILFGLQVMTEAGLIGDERCGEALELLQSKRLPDGGFPAEARYWHRITAEEAAQRGRKSGHELVEWGQVSVRKCNDWVTVLALGVLRAAGRY